MGLTSGKYFIKIISDIKFEIGIFKISNVPNLHKFLAFLILGLIWAEQVINVSENLLLTLYEPLVVGFWSMNFLRPQIVKSLVMVMCAYVVKVYNNYASALIIYNVNRHFSFYLLFIFHKKIRHK